MQFNDENTYLYRGQIFYKISFIIILKIIYIKFLNSVIYIFYLVNIMINKENTGYIYLSESHKSNSC